VRRDGTLSFPPKTRPVLSVDAVTIDGVSVDVDRFELSSGLLRPMALDGVRVVLPAYQDLGLPLGESGTWSVDYTWGSDPPAGGVLAAVELSVQLLRARHGAENLLPDRVARVVREGVDITMVDPLKLQEQGLIGVAVCDQFINTVNPDKRRTRPSIVNPDKVGR
jgi:hypothetical protein